MIGSALIGQSFTEDKYFHGRPSATTGARSGRFHQDNQRALQRVESMGSNLGPTSKALVDRVKEDVEKRKGENASAAVPIDLVTTSASGLDPHITPDGAMFQVPRVAKARNIAGRACAAAGSKHTEGRLAGLLGEPRVNVLALNMALDGCGAVKPAPGA